MKIKAIITSLVLAVVAGSTLAVGLVASSSSNVKEAKAANKDVFFNISEFGPKYGNNNEYDTQFSVNAFGSDNPTDYPQTWLSVTKVGGYPNVIKVSCDESYTTFIVVRSAQGTTNTWPNDSTESWNQTCNIGRSSSSTNYFWIYGTGEGFGQSYTPIDIKNTSLDVKNGVSTSLYFNYNTQEYGNASMSLNATQEFVITSGSTTYGYSSLDNGCKALFTEGENDYIVVKSTSLYEMYLKPNGTIWAQIDSFTEASTWAEDFVKNVGCTAEANAKPANWDSFASSFNNLSQGGKDTLIGATASNADGASYIQKAAFIHDMCVAKYAGCSVFMKRDGGGSRASSMNPITRSNNTAMIVVACSSVVAISLIATFLLLKKRKEN